MAKKAFKHLFYPTPEQAELLARTSCTGTPTRTTSDRKKSVMSKPTPS